MNSKSKVDFPMIKNNDFLICLYIIYYIYCILYSIESSKYNCIYAIILKLIIDKQYLRYMTGLE